MQMLRVLRERSACFLDYVVHVVEYFHMFLYPSIQCLETVSKLSDFRSLVRT